LNSKFPPRDDSTLHLGDPRQRSTRRHFAPALVNEDFERKVPATTTPPRTTRHFGLLARQRGLRAAPSRLLRAAG
jgi:hypothetical protein